MVRVRGYSNTLELELRVPPAHTVRVGSAGGHSLDPLVYLVRFAFRIVSCTATTRALGAFVVRSVDVSVTFCTPVKF